MLCNSLKESGKRLAYISSISAGVRRVTSGRMNQAMATANVPVPAKLGENAVSSLQWEILDSNKMKQN